MITGRVAKKEIDTDGNILVTFEFTLTDGSKVPGKAKYSWRSFSAAEVEANIKFHCENLMKKVYGLKANNSLANEIDLSKIAVSVSSVDVPVKVVTKQPDGTFIETEQVITIDDK